MSNINRTESEDEQCSPKERATRKSTDGRLKQSPEHITSFGSSRDRLRLDLADTVIAMITRSTALRKYTAMALSLRTMAADHI